jgi:hypothetical protein
MILGVNPNCLMQCSKLAGFTVKNYFYIKGIILEFKDA